MAAIKSSIDLAMERTEGMRLSAEERERRRHQQTKELAASLVLRWQSEDLSPEALTREVQAKEADNPGLRREMLGLVFRKVGLKAQEPSLLELIRLLDPEKSEEYQQIIESYRKEAETRKHALREDARRALMQQSVSGTAVVPNENGWQEWRAWLSSEEQAMREALLAALDFG
jgi:hypothetical protein